MENSTKLLGGISYIALIVFSVLSSVSHFISILSLIAAICVLVAFIQAGNQLGRPDVKNDIIIAIVLYIIATVLFVFFVGAGLAATLGTGGAGFGALGAGLIAGFFIGWVLFIIGAWFWYRASAALSEGTNVGLFKIGGLIIFIGAILTIIAVGFIVMWIGEIIQAIAFFTTPEKNSRAPTSSAAG
jgi:uncharacterized membrane protein